jgi:hypothetical protein
MESEIFLYFHKSTFHRYIYRYNYKHIYKYYYRYEKKQKKKQKKAGHLPGVNSHLRKLIEPSNHISTSDKREEDHSPKPVHFPAVITFNSDITSEHYQYHA